MTPPKDPSFILKDSGVSYVEQDEIIDGMRTLVEACHGLSSRSGWWTDPQTNQETPLSNDLFGMKIALIHSEVSEALEGYRRGKMDEHLPDRPSVEVELGDAIIRICDLAGKMGLDLGQAIVSKLAYNQTRLDHMLKNRVKPGGKAF